MTAALLAPIALALSVILIGPILAHLTRRPPRERRPFGLMYILRRLQRRAERRRRLHDRLLLLLRLLAVFLVLLAAARPELRWPEAAVTFGGTGRVVIVLDTSLSMDQRIGGEPAFALARKAAAEQLRALPEGVQIAVLTAAEPARLVTSGWTTDAELAAVLVEEQAQATTRTDLRGAMLRVRELLEGSPGEILVYTDESGPGVIEAAEEEISVLVANGAAILPRPFRADTPRNLAPVQATYGDGLEGGTVTVRLANWGPDSREVPTTITLPDGNPITAFIEVPGATEQGPGVAEERFTVPRQVAGGVARVEIDEPDLPLDNSYHFHLPRIGASRVLVVDGDPGATPTKSEVYFLERALAPWGTGGVTVDVRAPSGLLTQSLSDYRVLFLANVAEPSAVAGPVVDFVRGGGALVLGVGENVTADRYNAAFRSVLPVPFRKVRDLPDLDGETGTALALPDTSLELLRPFAQVGREGFGRVRVRRIMSLEPYTDSAEVLTLLKLSDGNPMLVERRIGAGRVLVWASTFDLGWTNFPLQSIYMPLLQRMVSWLGGEVGGATTRGTAVVGDRVRLEVPGTGALEVTGPDGHLISSAQEGSELAFDASQLGAYLIRTPQGVTQAYVAVNADARESDVRRTTSLAETQAKVLPDQRKRKLSLDLPVLGAALALLLASVLLSRRAEPNSERIG